MIVKKYIFTIGVNKLLNEPPSIGKANDIPIAKDNSLLLNHIETIVD